MKHVILSATGLIALSATAATAQKPRSPECFSLSVALSPAVPPFMRDAGLVSIPPHVRLEDPAGSPPDTRALTPLMEIGPGEEASGVIRHDTIFLTWQRDTVRTRVVAEFSGDSLRGVAVLTTNASARPAESPVTGARAACFDVPQSDSTDVVVAAFDSVMGAPPFAHPAGITSVFCLTLRGSLQTDGPQPLFMQRAAQVLAGRGTAVEGTGCRGLPASTHGSWMVDATGAPAVNVSISRLQFATSDEARIWISQTRAGRWGSVVLCTVSRSGTGTPWVARRCDLLLVS